VSISRKLRAYLMLTRPHNLVASLITTLIGWLTVYTAVHDAPLNPLYPMVTVALVAASGYVINDYYDAAVDAINKPYRPIPSGVVSRREALVFSLVLLIPAFILPCFSGPLSLAFVVLNTALLYAYSYRIKELGFLGNIVVAFEGAASIIYGGLSLAEACGRVALVKAALIPSLYAFLLLLGREVVKTIEDYRADAVRDVKSLPRVLGIEKAGIVAATILASVIAISPIPYLLLGYGPPYLALALATDIIIAYSIARLVRMSKMGVEEAERTAAKLRSWLKVAIFVGSLAFLIDLVLRAIGV